MLQIPAHRLRSDFARLLAGKFSGKKLAVVGAATGELREQLLALGVDATVCATVGELCHLLPQNGRNPLVDLAIWICPDSVEQAEAQVAELALLADDIILVPGREADVSKRRPRLVESLGKLGLIPDYQYDLTDLSIGAIRLVRNPVVNRDEFVTAVETAFARVNQRFQGLERTLRTRMSELEAADRHIANLEEKLLKLKEYRRSIKQLKEEKHALRKSPERKVGQVLLAPYRLPQKLVREARKHWPADRPPAQSEYQAWFERHRVTPAQASAMREDSQRFVYRPCVSIITPVFNTPVPWLREAVDSVLTQAYENWELILIDDKSSSQELSAFLRELPGKDSRIVLVESPQHGGISAASNRGLEAACGEWIGFLDHDDVLEPDALFQHVKLLQEHHDADLIYSDEDKLTEDGLDSPIMKPDWSPDFFLSCNYICHFTIIRCELLRQIGGLRSEFDGAQDYDLFFRIIERTPRIHHVPRVLYHWRRSAASTADNIRRKPQSLETGRCAVEAHLKRTGKQGHVAVDWRTHAYWIRRDIPDAKMISIIIPVRDRVDLLKRCLSSLTSRTSYEPYEIVVVDNESASDEAREFFSSFPHRLLRFSGPFNFSAINNFAVEQTDSPWLLFLNNDTEIIESGWLTAMAEHVQRSEVGAVGARLLFSDDTVQHAGIVVGVGGIAEHAFRGFPAEAPGVCRQLQVMRNYSAVTGACLMTRREVFEEVGGFDEERLPVTFNDVDLCLKMRRAGYLVVYTPFAKLYHHESATRRPAVEARETGVMRERWSDLLENDPYYNPNLSRERADFSLGN
ncbi:MAG: glycosyltransferase family 2 protein [Chthoniobacterales bacterium]|nr:glycosyltransferase family 2 protein [Chthoniobacterales bacterium]